MSDFYLCDKRTFSDYQSEPEVLLMDRPCSAQDPRNTLHEEPAEKVRAADKKMGEGRAIIDRLEEEISEDAARLIALRFPTAGNLRLILAIDVIARDILVAIMLLERFARGRLRFDLGCEL